MLIFKVSLSIRAQSAMPMVSGCAVLRSSGPVSQWSVTTARALPSRSVTPLPEGRVTRLRRLIAAFWFLSCVVPQDPHGLRRSRLSFAFTKGITCLEVKGSRERRRR